MEESRPVTVHHPDAEPPPPRMSGPERAERYARTGCWADWITNDAGDVSGWHHHATNHTYVYVIRGSVAVEFGPGGSDRIVAGAGDLFVVPPDTIHRELTGEDSDLEAFVVRVGGEPEDRLPATAGRGRRSVRDPAPIGGGPRPRLRQTGICSRLTGDYLVTYPRAR